MSLEWKMAESYVLIRGKYLFPSLCNFFDAARSESNFQMSKLNMKRKRVDFNLEIVKHLTVDTAIVLR